MIKQFIMAAMLVACTFCVTSSTVAQSPLTVQVTLDAGIADQPISGRLYVFFSQRSAQPMNGPSWFGPEPFFAMDVNDLAPGSTITVDDSAAFLMGPLSKLPAGKYTVQAVLDHDFYFASHLNGPGNFYSEPAKLNLKKDGAADGPLSLLLNQSVKAATYEESEFVKFITLESKLLGDFHKRQVLERAMVVLPPSYYKEPNRRYPVYFDVTGFGATLAQLQGRWQKGQKRPGDGETEFIRVFLTGQCKWGHHVYANSATNGPRGDMLVNEMIPQIDQQFRTVAAPTARFVGGHSSGGWSSLWLQVNYPDAFGGVWSTAPDPVDFRDWQGTNLYEDGANVYFDAAGQKRPLARNNGRVLVYYQNFSQMDDVLGRGGQIRSFDAVFSPLGEDDKPAKMWDRETGKVRPEILDYWKQYDISRILQQNWSELQPKLAGKLHVYMGDEDTFYLENATRLLGERLKGLGSDAVIEMFPGKDHMNLLNSQMKARINREMSQQFWKNHPPK